MQDDLQLTFVAGAVLDSPVETPIYSLGFPLTLRSLSIFSPGITKMPYNYYMHSSLQNTMRHNLGRQPYQKSGAKVVQKSGTTKKAAPLTLPN